MISPRPAVLLALLLLAAAPLAACGDDEPLGRDADAGGKATASAGLTTEQLTAAAIERTLPSVVAVSVTRGGVTRTGTGTVLMRGYVVTDSRLVGGAARPTPTPTPKPTPKPTPTPSATPASTTPTATTPRSTTPAATTPRATTPSGTTPATPKPAPKSTPRPVAPVAATATVTVRDADGDEHAGTVEGTDIVSGLAVLRVGELESVPVAKAGDAPKLGEQVAAVGYLAARRPAVRPGTLVTVGRAVRSNREVEVGLVEATAPLGGQGIGGPLVDDRGRVVAITTSSLQSVIPGSVVGLPYASALRIAKALGSSGRVRRAYLGIDTVGITPDRAEELQLSTSAGVLVRSIVAGSPASFSTLRGSTGMTRIGGRLIPTGSDAITKIDGKPIREPEDLDAALATRKPGDRVALQVIRGTRGLVVHVTLGER